MEMTLRDLVQILNVDEVTICSGVEELWCGPLCTHLDKQNVPSDLLSRVVSFAGKRDSYFYIFLG